MSKLFYLLLILCFLHGISSEAEEITSGKKETIKGYFSEVLKTSNESLTEIKEFGENLAKTIKSYLLDAHIELLQFFEDARSRALNAISEKICSGPEKNKKNGLILQICQEFLTENNLKRSEQL